MKVITDDKYTTAESGLIYYDIVEGQGESPKDGQQVFALISLHNQFFVIHFVIFILF